MTSTGTPSDSCTYRLVADLVGIDCRFRYLFIIVINDCNEPSLVMSKRDGGVRGAITRLDITPMKLAPWALQPPLSNPIAIGLVEDEEAENSGDSDQIYHIHLYM